MIAWRGSEEARRLVWIYLARIKALVRGEVSRVGQRFKIALDLLAASTTCLVGPTSFTATAIGYLVLAQLLFLFAPAAPLVHSKAVHVESARL